MHPDLFTCKECGSHDLLVVHEYCLVRDYETSVACECGKEEAAVVVHTVERTPVREDAPLEDDHHWPVGERGEGDTKREQSREVHCAQCAEQAGEEDRQAGNDSEAEIEDDEFYVRCAGCDREIPFGWSHPERGGRIWPVECTDHDPRKSWPEPRYADEWDTYV